jgi:ectoine hydroxylase-related dioxygenase (phytanoyl-CoA dioxygenase family)
MGKGGGGYNGPAMLQTIRHPALLSCIESLIGPDIVGSSVYRIRPKLPGWDRGEVPWHQDAGYTLAHCDRHLIVTCWVPLVDATLENGCLHVIPTVHSSGILKHFTGGHAGFLEVPQDELPQVDPVPVPMKAGDVLLLTNLTPHASFENRTDQVRWSIDLRYQSADVPNNVDEDPASYTPERDPVTMACYPPEADFVIRDRKDPAREIQSADQFRQVRQRYETTRPNTPGRGWTPLQER